MSVEQDLRGPAAAWRRDATPHHHRRGGLILQGGEETPKTDFSSHRQASDILDESTV